MDKAGFLEELRRRLSGLPREELEERLSFYGEMLDDRMEEGLTEAEAVAGLGSPEQVAEQILAEVPLTKILKETVRRRSGAGKTVLLILGSPLWFPLLLAAFAVAFSL